MLLQSETKIEPDLRLQVFSKNLKRQISRSHVTKPWTNLWSSQRGFSTPGSRASRDWLTWTSFILNFCLGHVLIGSLSDDDGDGNENGKKAIGLDLLRKTTTLHVDHAFLYISLPSLHDYDVKMPNFTFCAWRTLTQDNDFLFLFLNFDTPSLLESNSRKNCQHLTNWTKWNIKAG